MKFLQLAPGICFLRGGSNVGLLTQGEKALLIDAGLDKDVGRRIRRVLNEMDLKLKAILITHAHADHFGGAHYLATSTGAPVYAPPLEAAIVAHPLLEPLYLFSGASPPRELRRKFTLAQACPVEALLEPGSLALEGFKLEVVPLPGHSPHQVGIGYRHVLFCADAFFPPETLRKHPVPFCVDMDAALDTLARLPELPYSLFAPGHGEAVQDARPLVELNARRLSQIREFVHQALAFSPDTAMLLKSLANRYDLRLRDAPDYYLAQTTVHAALSSLQREGKAAIRVEDNRLLWVRKERAP